MLRDKMQAVMAELNAEIAERGELIHAIALALLSGSNLFILGAPGQAKSFAINEFRKRITGAKQFERLLSKQCDEEALFGRLDLASLIPGAVPAHVLEEDAVYQTMKAELTQTMTNVQADPADVALNQQMQEQTERLAAYQKSLSMLHSGQPTTITTGKIPDSHICFLDEIYKANDGILNSLLTAINEKRYTNEGVTVALPTISFFAASNELPNFRNKEEQILAPLHDRLHLKVVTQNVQDRAARLRVLDEKQGAGYGAIAATVTLDELYAMQAQVKLIAIPATINELMDDVLCELRRQGVTVSDRKYFGYGRIAQSAAWLAGHDAVQPDDLLALKNYLWNEPQEIETVAATLRKLCDNPMRTRLEELLARGTDICAEFEKAPADKRTRALVRLRTEFAKLYNEWHKLDSGAQSVDDHQLAGAALDELDEMSRRAHESCSFTYMPLDQLAVLQAAV